MVTKHKQAAKKQSRATQSKRTARDVKLEFERQPDMLLLYADNINIIHTPTEFIISFMQAQPPVLTSDDQWNAVDSIKSKCVARIVVSPMKMELMIKALATNFQKYIRSYIQTETDNGDDNTKTDSDARTP